VSRRRIDRRINQAQANIGALRGRIDAWLDMQHFGFSETTLPGKLIIASIPADFRARSVNLNGDFWT